MLLHLITGWHAPANFPELAIFLIHSTNCKLPMFKTNPEYSDCHCSREQIISGKNPNSGECFRPSLTQESQSQRYRDSTEKAMHPVLPGAELPGGLVTLHRLKFYQICFPHSSTLLQAISGHHSLYLSPPTPHLYFPPRNLRYWQRKSSDSESRSNCRLLGLTSFSPGISSAFWTATTLRTWHVNSESYRRDGKKSQDMAFRQSKTWEQYCYL